MAGFRERDKRHFPLKSVQDVVKLFRDQLENCADPDLTLLSIVAGAVESCLTTTRQYIAGGSDGGTGRGPPCFPVLQLNTAEALYQRFLVHIKANVDLTKYDGKYATRDFVKKVSDVIWNSLSRSFRDKAHLQSLYSYLTGNKLDCFGVALAVVAGCQILGFNDVHLALSEDHAWVVYGESGEETAEVTWHGKGNEDKRGLPVGLGVAEKSWLYLNGHAVICNRHMEVASIVSGMNPAINSSMDSVEMGALQQELLWLLHDLGHLNKYPMALGNLGDLEEITPTPNRPTPEKIFQKAIAMSCKHYENMHVYPYTYLGGFYYRRMQYKEAVKQWAEAGQVISKYNYNRDDEEIYKEFLEIANELIPHIVKQASNVLALMKPKPLIQDPECYSLLLQFYDGICQWEEDSNTPVLHITWAKHLVQSLSKFHCEARANIHVEREEGETSSEDEDTDDGYENKDQVDRVKGELKWKLRRDSVSSDSRERRSVEKKGLDSDFADDAPTKRGRGRPPKRKSYCTSGETADNNNEVGTKDLSSRDQSDDDKRSEIVPSPQDDRLESDSSPMADTAAYEEPERDPEEQKIKSTIEKLASKVGKESQNQQPNPSIAALAQACGDSILNPNFLLGVGEPFTTKPPNNSNFFNTSTDSNKVDLNDFLSTRSNNNPFLGLTVDSMFKTDKSSQVEVENGVRGTPVSIAASAVSTTSTISTASTHSTSLASASTTGSTSSLTPAEPSLNLNGGDVVAITNGGGHSSPSPDSVSDKSISSAPCNIKLNLYSAKMRGLKELLCAEKLNASAINLQLTAQSQVHLKHSKVGNDYGYTGMRKRPRRE